MGPQGREERRGPIRFVFETHGMDNPGDLEPGGGLSAAPVSLAEPRFSRVTDWCDKQGIEVHLVLSSSQPDRLGLDSPETCEKLADSILGLLAGSPDGVSGVQLDVEGLRSEGPVFEGFLQLLDELRAKLGPEDELGVAVPKWAWNGRDSEWQWSRATLDRFGATDYVVVMNYDWGEAVKHAEDYACVTRDTVEALAPDLGSRLVVGVPAYAATRNHDPAVENSAAAAAGLAAARGVDKIRGIAVHWLSRQEIGALSSADWDALRGLLTPQITFALTFGRQAVWAEPVSGGYALAGSSPSEQGECGWLTKTDADGKEIWSHAFRTGGGGEIRAAQSAGDGGYILCGLADTFGGQGWDAWVVRTDSEGNGIWSRTFGGPGYDAALSVQPTADGGFIVAGQTSSFGAGETDIWLLKVDAQGNETWSRTFGGADEECPGSVRPTPDGGYVVAGYSDSFGAGSGDIPGIPGDIWLVKTDANGNRTWDRTFGDAWPDQAYDVRPTTDGGYVIAGTGSVMIDPETPSASDSDAWLIKTDAEGNELWFRTFGGPESESAFSVELADDGGYILAGKTESYGAGGSDAWLIKTDADGEEEWLRTFGDEGQDAAWSVQTTPDGGYIIAGRSGSNGWLVKTGGIVHPGP